MVMVRYARFASVRQLEARDGGRTCVEPIRVLAAALKLTVAASCDTCGTETWATLSVASAHRIAQQPKRNKVCQMKVDIRIFLTFLHGHTDCFSKFRVPLRYRIGIFSGMNF